MVIIGVSFKPNTAESWVIERFTKIGLNHMPNGITGDSQFFLIANLVSFNALVRVPDRDELKYMRAIKEISPMISNVSRMD